MLENINSTPEGVLFIPIARAFADVLIRLGEEGRGGTTGYEKQLDWRLRTPEGAKEVHQESKAVLIVGGLHMVPLMQFAWVLNRYSHLQLKKDLPQRTLA